MTLTIRFKHRLLFAATSCTINSTTTITSDFASDTFLVFDFFLIRCIAHKFCSSGLVIG